MRIITCLLLFIMATICSVKSDAATFIGDRNDFRDETIYFVMTTRFYDGDSSNNTYCWDGTLNENDPEWRGDFKGLIQKLDYIKALGFTAVWITPVVENASGLDYHGYHAFNFSKVDPRYESDDCKFQDLIDAAHNRGMKIILDIVLQHTGNFGEENLCPMFEKDYTQNLSNIDKSMKLHPNTTLPANYFSLEASAQYSARLSRMKNTTGVNYDVNNYWHHVGNNWNWDDPSRWWGQIAGDCVDLNTENPYVTEYLVKCYGKFIEMGVDGFRIDTSGHISRLTFNNAFIPQFTELAEKYKDARNGGPFFMYGEVCARDRNVTYRNHENCSPYFYTWKESSSYAWDYSTTSWNGVVVWEGEYGNHTNANSVLAQGNDYLDDSGMPTSTNAFLNGNDYHTPDHSQYSGLSVIDFPMHWNFRSASEAYSVKYGDNLYNDATYNVVYVDSHDYAPDGAPESQRFSQSQDTWAENLSLMFTFRGIPCLYYGSEIEFKKGCTIDNGANLALKNSGRAYFGGYMEGNVTASDFAEYSADGNAAASLSHPLALHIQRLNKIRAAIPALRKGQYSTDGCSGTFAFKRRYVDDNTDSYVLVTISGSAEFTGIENGVYVDAVTGDTQTVTNGKLSVSCSGKGNLRAYVLSTSKTSAPGKIGTDGMYIYNSSSAGNQQKSYTSETEPLDTETVKDTSTGGGGTVEEPENPIDPSMSEGEQAVFFENDSNWGGTIRAWVWNDSENYTGGSWPGEACTYLGNNIWKWTYSGTNKVSGYVIFNNGSSQTADLTYVNGGYYNNSGYVKTIEGAGEIPDDNDDDTPTENSTLVAYFNNASSSWSSVYAYVWDSGNGNKEYLGGWPGTSLSKDDASGYYKVSATGTFTTPMIIFNNGSGTQTADLSFINNAIYTASGYTGLYDGSSDTPDTPSAGDNTWTFYYSDTNWANSVYAYVWDGGNGNKEYLGGWPGSAMTYDSANSRWEISFTTTDTLASPMVVFNNGSGSQTADLNLTNLGIYKYSGLDSIATSFVETLAEDCEPIEYYNMQGVKVLNPENGIYIKRQGGKVQKVIL